ncbi:MAG: WhiB family transcriptional regulator [Acidimicrobiales bacterium]
MSSPTFYPTFQHSRRKWQDAALCAGMDSDLFFPERGDSRKIVDTAKELCAGCPVRSECLELGMEEKFGVWGGTTEQERRKLRRGVRATLQDSSNSTLEAS